MLPKIAKQWTTFAKTLKSFNRTLVDKLSPKPTEPRMTSISRSAAARLLAGTMVVLASYVAAFGQAEAQTVIYQDDFEAGASGWSDNTTENASVIGTNILGRFGGGNDVTRTFTVPALSLIHI